jgi:hypothetical protein
MNNKFFLIRKTGLMSCVWVPTDNAKAPLACVWVEEAPQAASTPPSSSTDETGGMLLCA